MTCQPNEVYPIRNALRPCKSELIPRLWTVAERQEETEGTFLRAVSLLAEYDQNNSRWAETSNRITGAIVRENVLHAAEWLQLLRPVKQHLIEPLKIVYFDRNNEQTSGEREIASELLNDYSDGDIEIAKELILGGRPRQFNKYFHLVEHRREATLSSLAEELKISEMATKSQMEFRASRIAKAAITALKLNEPKHFLKQLKHGDDDTIRSTIVNLVRDLEVDPGVIVRLIEQESDVSTRRALLQILGTFEAVPSKDTTSVESKLAGLLRDDPDPGIHAAARFAMSKLGMGTAIDRIESELAGAVNLDQKWFVTKTNQHSFAILDGPVEFSMGAPKGEVGSQSDETRHRVRIGHSIAVGTTEVTTKQFRKFEREMIAKKLLKKEVYFPPDIAPDQNCPRIGIDWFHAAAYCRWLSEREGIAEDQMCYPPIKQIKPGMKLPADFLSRTGYRLPTEAEWEYACRAGSSSSRFFGNPNALIRHYAWGLQNSDWKTHPVAQLIPNDLSLIHI